MDKGFRAKVFKDENGLYIKHSDGGPHRIGAQADDGEPCVGLYHIARSGL